MEKWSAAEHQVLRSHQVEGLLINQRRLAMVSKPTSDGLQPSSNGLQPIYSYTVERKWDLPRVLSCVNGLRLQLIWSAQVVERTWDVIWVTWVLCSFLFFLFCWFFGSRYLDLSFSLLPSFLPCFLSFFLSFLSLCSCFLSFFPSFPCVLAFFLPIVSCPKPPQRLEIKQKSISCLPCLQNSSVRLPLSSGSVSAENWALAIMRDKKEHQSKKKTHKTAKTIGKKSRLCL